MNARTRTLALGLLIAAAPAAFAQKDAPANVDPDPEIERKSFQVADGFEVNLFAADPLLAKPIAMNFDPAGRLWVATSEAYPQIKPGAIQNDKIIVLEDTKGTGVADRTTVFAEGLLIPTGVLPGDGGAYVMDSTDLLFLKDTDGDGKADKREVLLSGFGTEDTHHMVHALRWGPDGLMYFNQSVYIHTHMETPHGVRVLNGSGTWQFRPASRDLSVFCRGLVNPWGVAWDRWGATFETDGAGGEGINYTFPGAAFTTAVGTTRILQGLNPGSPKDCGLEIISGRAFPDDWQGNLITNDFRAHRVCRYVLTPEGSGYTSKEMPELIKTNHPAFRPIDVKMGPDGALYIADWYNPIIQHGEVDFRDPRRDVTHGRIWRVTAKGRKTVDRPKLVGAKTEDLLDALKAPEDWTRRSARRVMQERGAEAVAPALTAWTAKLDPAVADNEPALLEALWTYQAFDIVEPKLLAEMLDAKDYRVRAAAVRVASAWAGRLSNPLELLAPRVRDDEAQVRLEAVRALAVISSVHSAELALEALDRPMDKWLDYALWLTVRDLEPEWSPALQKGAFNYGGNPRRLLFALEATGTKDALGPLVKLVKDGKASPDQEESVLTLIAALGGPKELALVLDRALDDKAPAARRANLLTALARAAEERRARPAGDRGRIVALLKSDNDAARAAAARLAGDWGLVDATGLLGEYASDPKTSAALQQAAVGGLAALNTEQSKTLLDDLSRSDKAPSRRIALIALASVDLDQAAKDAPGVLRSLPDGDEAADLFNAFLERKNGAKLLAAALGDRPLNSDVAKVGVRAVRISGREAPELVDALTKAGGLKFGARTVSEAEMKQLVADVQKFGDPARGELVFRRRDQLCLKCHAIAGCGGQVGPDLSSVGASAQIDYLIDSVITPNKQVKENYHAVLATTQQGLSYTGIKVQESPDKLVLRTADDKEINISIKDIDERKMGGSLMPDGLTDVLTRSEFLDLIRFLSELGKVGPYSVSKARLVRRWQVLAVGSVNDAVGDSPESRWEPAYSTVTGVLPLDELPRRMDGSGGAAVVRCQMEASTPGPVVLRLNPQGLRLWLDRKAVDLKEATELDVPAGVHTLTFAVDLGQRKEPLRCELEDRAGSPARVRVVGGK
ncbi:MAG TPA: PVC-type heme-binding CxxCH protein [Gemmataceae bacterium]|nr:PVC-type heme-binding CxxCH protein [Gemmataceae bacterium]